MMLLLSQTRLLHYLKRLFSVFAWFEGFIAETLHVNFFTVEAQLGFENLLCYRLVPLLKSVAG